MKLTDFLTSARKKYGPEVHLRKHQGLRQVIWFASSKVEVKRDSSGVVVMAETRGSWKEMGVTQ